MRTADIIVVGAGHAGCEAALASARLGKTTIVFAISLDSVASMPCNPNVGGTSKGHLVREIDALGGEMGKNIDKTYIQNRMLNTGKGPAVHSLRAQADKYKYSAQMKKTLENTPGLFLVQEEVVDVIVENKAVCGIVTQSGAIYHAKAVIICGGTYFRSRCLYGATVIHSGPGGLKSSSGLSENLQALGLFMYRFKTGTPARIDRRSMDLSKMEPQYGDEFPAPFSFANKTEDIQREQVKCYLTYTNEETHKIILANIHRSPMYSGEIDATGTRYCPSIEDKIVRFKDKERHQVFIEPEGLDTNEMYISGMSTSLPEDVQQAMYRTLPGLENCHITRFGYAIEYDALDATALHLSLETKAMEGLFFAGQMNGSSGYEEAAAQGIMAGINAVQKIEGKPPLVLDRSQGYIGVLIDDLVTKGTKEPYRMMTGRAEYRLLLRQDNADLRLRKFGFQVGLIDKEQYEIFLKKERQIENEIQRVKNLVIPPGKEINRLLSAEITTGIKLSELIKRPELNYDKLSLIDKSRPSLPEEVREQVNIQIKYEGYISRQIKQVEQFKKNEKKLLPKDIDYLAIKGLRLEAGQKLDKIRPASIGHASRISGVSPADISVLLIKLESGRMRV